ncbi:hypothetical protein BST81_22735 [Leptolyngbya sp. 'hensonii']|uniref:ribosomal maturation YjgA family protein n=1 Tax=Leptolyngbya sp. 'hensonii' TaxID=1922337 RepID=UPI0009502200|nr:DUF2809 domain-containing protein [Leptolyngbya sp. 'hensonii']OLP16050.1 hypothetical protein BST81_22735 [Leptolyngbya sp. 'hensonii']
MAPPYRLSLWVSLIVIIPIGYGLRFYGPGPEWLDDLLGGIAYEMFWILLLLLLLPKRSPASIAIGVCLVTCAMEVLQLWQNPVFKSLQATWLGRAVLGNTFTWSDFPNYVLGSGLGWLYVRFLHHHLTT